jgi:hypothetical protein
VLLFANRTSDLLNTWTAKLYDFRNAETKDRTAPKTKPKRGGVGTRDDLANGETTFTYDGIYGWTPPEALLN